MKPTVGNLWDFLTALGIGMFSSIGAYHIMKAYPVSVWVWFVVALFYFFITTWYVYDLSKKSH